MTVDGIADAIRGAPPRVHQSVQCRRILSRTGYAEKDFATGWLDRLGRSLPELLALVEDLTARRVGLWSLAEQIDTASAAGRLVLHVFGALAEFERALMPRRGASTTAPPPAPSQGHLGPRRSAPLPAPN